IAAGRRSRCGTRWFLFRGLRWRLWRGLWLLRTTGLRPVRCAVATDLARPRCARCGGILPGWRRWRRGCGWLLLDLRCRLSRCLGCLLLIVAQGTFDDRDFQREL